MSIAFQHAPLVSPEEYLADEIVAEQKHEFLNGVVYVREGSSLGHSSLAVRLGALLYGQLRGKGCRVFNSDVLLRVERGSDLRFYYPDISIYCGSIPRQERVIDDATVIFEVPLSIDGAHRHGRKAYGLSRAPLS